MYFDHIRSIFHGLRIVGSIGMGHPDHRETW